LFIRRSPGWLFLLLLAGPARAQQGSTDVGALAARLASLSAVTGFERAMVDTLLRLLPRAVRDRAGNARVQVGGGSVKRLVVCPLDEPGYVVGGIRDDGFLTLRRVSGKVSPLFDQQIEGQRVTIQGRRPVPGVVAVRSIHLTRGRTAPSELPFTVDDAVVDVGAASRDQVLTLGVRVLSPVTLAKQPHRYGENLLAAPMAGRRAACAALVGALTASLTRANSLPPATVAFVVEQELSHRGLATIANEAGPFEETIVIDSRPGNRGVLDQRADTLAQSRWARLGQVKTWSLPVQYAGTAVETVAVADADSLQQRLMRWIGRDP
jgi:putative aminopeptidase